MHAFILQEWTTIRGAANTNVTQSEDQWLDLSPYQDVFFYLDCREFTGAIAPALSYQTSPTKDEALFQTMIGPNNFVVGVAAVTKSILSTNPAVPLARYARWFITGPANAWDATFRVLVAANSPGM
jgi:hypothetical protein